MMPRYPVLMVVRSSHHAMHVQKFFTPREMVVVPAMRAPMNGEFRALLISVGENPPAGFEDWLTTHIRPRLAPGCQGFVTYL